MNSPLLLVLSGPSGVGKDSILERMRELNRPFHYTITATTRAPRDGEVDGQDYYFVTPAWFAARERESGLLEHACVYGKTYGVPKAPVLRALRKGQDVIMRTNVEGAASIRLAAPGAVLVFVCPPSLAQLEDRLRGRQTEGPEEIARRLAKVREEMECLPSFDYAIENADNQIDKCVEMVDAIVLAERCRVGRPLVSLR